MIFSKFTRIMRKSIRILLIYIFFSVNIIDETQSLLFVSFFFSFFIILSVKFAKIDEIALDELA